MVDLVSIGVSGLSAYQRALATTSNNIANLQTEGYVRQRALLETAGQDNTSRISLGNGVRFAEIQRLYDRFAEENLQRASSSLKAEEALLTELQALQDSIGSSEAGLHSAFQNFFNAARDLEAAPASPGSRAGFLAAADGLAARFRGLADAVATQDDTTRAQIDQAVGEVNVLLADIANLNSALLKRATDAEQPMQLLDRRDAALKSLAEKIGITIEVGPSGAVTVYSGDSTAGVALVENGRSRTMSTTFDPYDFGKVEYVLDAASQPVVLSNVRTGTLGGMTSFRSQALGNAAETLDKLAIDFGRAVNRLHRQGLDSLGRPGQDLFYTGPDFTVSAKANAGMARMNVSVADPEAVQPHPYEIRYNQDKDLWVLRNLRSGSLHEAKFDVVKQAWTVKNVGTNKVTSESRDLLIEGLKVTIQGSAKNGDTFLINPENHPALVFRTLIKEGSEVASAAKLMTRAALNNEGSASALIRLGSAREASYTPRTLVDLLPRSTLSGEQTFSNNVSSRADTEIGASNMPIAVIGAGMRKVALGTASMGGELAVFTRDGRQISGPAMSASVVTTANGFHSGAIYSSDYLNKTGTAAYLDKNFIRGPYQEAGSQIDADGKRVLTPATIYSDTVDLNGFTAAGTFDLVINGKAITVNVPTPVTVAGIASAISDNKSTTGVIAEASTDGKLVFKTYQEISVPSANFDSEPRITIGGTEFSVTTASLAAINATRAAQVPALGALTPKEYLRDLINGAKIGITASIATASGNLVLANSEGNSGKPIAIGANDLGLIEKTYFNEAALSISAPPTASTATLRSLGLRSGFAMSEPLAEDLLVFGVSSQGLSSKVFLSGTYETGAPPAALAGDERDYSLRFEGGEYSLVDKLTTTEVSRGKFDLSTRQISYANWTVTMTAIPFDEDTFTISKTDDPIGDNRIIADIAALQFDREILGTDQTVQQEYENLVNRVGAVLVQSEVAKEAQKVVFDHAKESRDRVAGVNLDEELADLLRFQQAYQANAQVVQVANRLFDSLLQRL